VTGGPLDGAGPFSPASVRGAYDAVAPDYGRRFGDDLDRLPLDRALLDAASDSSPPGPVLEAGCGPAPAARHLGGRASALAGLDLSAGMLAVARERDRALPLVQGDLRHLPLRDGCCGLVIAMYTLHNLARTELPVALAEIHRVLGRRGVLLMATHLGTGDVVTEEFLGHRVDAVGGTLYDRDDLVDLGTAAGFAVEREERRGPLAHEGATERIYLLLRRVT
jgi:ubiquinone/menaquinone biosynthesis C-methylase UbiE